MPNFTVTTELFYDGVWNDISIDVRVPAGVDIQWGRSDGASGPEPSRLSLTFNNAGGKYSPRNPNSPLSGKIGRNTQIRVTISSDLAFTGEVSSWPTRWNIPGTNQWVTIEAAGLLRRINQGTQPGSSSLRDFYLNTSPVIYWPLTDGETATTGAPAAGSYMGSSFHRASTKAVYSFGQGTLASYLPPTLRINDTQPAAGYDRFYGRAIGSSAAPTALALDLLWKIDTEIVPGTMTAYPAGIFDIHLLTAAANGATDDWSLYFRHDGLNDGAVLELFATDPFGTVTQSSVAVSTPSLAAVLDTNLHHVRLQLTQNGANVDTAVFIDGVAVGMAATVTSHTLQRVDAVTVEYNRNSNTTDGLIAIGHVAVYENTVNVPNLAATYLAVQGYAGERAGRRIERLCGLTAVPFDALGVNLDDSQAMGLQYEDGFSGQLAECEATDMGLIYEHRDTLALGYRTRASLYAQTPVAVIDYELGELSPPLEPVDDDQTTRNDVFAQRREGGSSRVTVTSGPLSVADPPAGVGRYKDEYQVNVQTDGMLDGIGAWRVRLGTVDAARFPSVTINRNNPAVAASPLNLSITVRSVNAGDLIRIKGGPKLRAAAGVYDDIDLLVLGGRRFTDGFNDIFTFNCAPYEPYAVAKWSTDRFDTAGSTLTAGVTSSATSLSVASPSTLWTTAGGSFPFDITVAGERMTVTNITGATSPQIFTVTRSVNGVIKAQASGAAVRLFKTPRYGLGN